MLGTMQSQPTYATLESKNKNKTFLLAGVLAIILIIGAVVFISVLNSNTNQNSSVVPASKPVDHIDYFLVSQKGDIAQVQFALMTSDLDFQATDGTASLQIIDASTNKVLYSDSFVIKKTDFNYYQTLLGKTVLACQWTIPLSDIQKCVSSGTATLTFTTNDKESFESTENYVSLPAYTEGELKQVYENQYTVSAKTIGQTVTHDNFKLTLVSLGTFTHLKYDTVGSEVTDFRVDFTVTCVSSDPQYLFESNFVVIDNLGNQYYYTYGGTLKLGEIYPGVTRQGYLLFSGLNPDATSLQIIAKENSYPNDINYQFDVTL